MTESIERVFKVFIHGTEDDVWREITKTHEVQKVMFNMRLDSRLEVGSPWAMRTANGKFTGIVGEVVEWQPKKRFTHTFRFTNYDDPPCKVTHLLEEKDGGVEYTMIVFDMPPNTKSTKQMAQGGEMIIKNLKSIVETGELPFTTRLLYGVFALTAPFTPKRLRTENWT